MGSHGPLVPHLATPVPLMAFNVQENAISYTNFQKSPYHGRGKPTPFPRSVARFAPPPPLP